MFVYQMEFPNRSIQVDYSTMLNSVEFSRQLVYNADDLTNEQEDNQTCGSYVSEWLLPMLSTCQTVVMRKTEFPIISKKIRDDVMGAKHQVVSPPFRRSKFWTFLKAILQFNVTVALDEMSGRILYKLVMLKVLTILCSYYHSEMYATLNVDIVLHTLAKLARRIEKMNRSIALLEDDHLNKFQPLPNGFEDVYNATMDESKLVIFKVRAKLDRQIHLIQSSNEESSSLVPLSDLAFESDVHQKVPTLRKYLETRQVPPVFNPNEEKLKVKVFVRHPIGSEVAPDINLFAKLKNPVDVGIFLCDFENWIMYVLVDIHSCTPETLRSLSFGYGQLAAKHYRDDPLGFSRMVLTQLKIVYLLDKIATNAHSALKTHRPGINYAIIDNLLLPQYDDFEIAHELKKYFAKRSEKVKYPSLIEEEKVTTNSFAHRFAEKSDEMQDILDRIGQSADATKAKIQKEWQLRRKEVDDLRKRQATMQCEYVTNSNGKRQHKDSCSCCKLATRISNIRVTTFELPLPDNVCERNAIVFELRIPVEIACLRDVLYEVVTLLNEPGKKIRIFDKWIRSSVLEEFDQSNSERVFLGSTVKGHVVGRTRNRGMCELHFNFIHCYVRQ